MMWIARDRDAQHCVLYVNKPKVVDGTWWPIKTKESLMILPDDIFEEITFENSPQEVSVVENNAHRENLKAEYKRGFFDGEMSGFDDGYECCLSDYGLEDSDDK